MFDGRYLVDHASDAAFAIDCNSKVVAWNYAARRLLGHKRREVLGQHCSEVLQAVCHKGEPLCSPDCEGASCFRNLKAFNSPPCRARRRDGGWVSVKLSTMVMPRATRDEQSCQAMAVIMLKPEEETKHVAPAARTLRIFTLGRFCLTAGGSGLELEKWERKQALTLLKYLVANLGHPVHRETLIDFFWPEIDEDRGWKRLKVTVHYLRCQLRAAGITENIVETAGQTYVLRPEGVWLDVHAFECCAAEGAQFQQEERWDKALGCYEEAQNLYRGDYMEEDLYDDWCTAKREHLFEVYLEMLAKMAECHAEVGHYDAAVQVCRTALIRDPGRESFHRSLMEYLVQLGRDDWAIEQYHRCRRLLIQELDVEPMLDTQRLYRLIIESSGRLPVEKQSKPAGE